MQCNKIDFGVEFNSCDALDPENHTWGSVFHSMVKRGNVLDNMVFKLSPFKTSCFAVKNVDGKIEHAEWSAEFLGNFLQGDLSGEKCWPQLVVYHDKGHRNCY